MKLKKTWPSMARHLYIDKDGAQYLNEKPVFEEIKEIPEGIDHLEFRVRLLDAQDSVTSTAALNLAVMSTRFTGEMPRNKELASAANLEFQEFLRSLESWNLTDDKDHPIPITEEAIHQLPKWIYLQMFAAADKVNSPKN